MTRGELKVAIPIERLQRIAGIKAPFCGVPWAERAQPLVIPTKFLRVVMTHPRIATARCFVYGNCEPNTPSEIEIVGKGFSYTLKHHGQQVVRPELWQWAEQTKRRIVAKANPEASKRARELFKAKERLRIDTKRHGVSKPVHPLCVARAREYAGEYSRMQDLECKTRQARDERRARQIRQTLGRIVAPFLKERGRHWQAELKAALQARGLDVSYGFSRVSRVRHGNWTEGDPEIYLKALWRDVTGWRYSGGYKERHSDPAGVIESCREWRDVRLLKYLEWKQRERMLLQDIADVETGMEAGDDETATSRS